MERTSIHERAILAQPINQRARHNVARSLVYG